MAPMIVLFTDFGLEGPYIGQVKTVLHRMAPGVPVIDLFADLPPAKPRPAAYLLAAYSLWFPSTSIFLAVVDPGVGGERAAVIVEADGRWGERHVGGNDPAGDREPEGVDVGEQQDHGCCGV